MILETVYNKTYAQILDQKIVTPLKLANTHYGSAINTKQNEAKSYYLDSGWKAHSQDDMSIPLGAGGIVSTPSDLCLFAQALLDGQLISAESVQQMKPVGEDSYGFALYGTAFNEMNGWGHGGNIDAFASNMICFEEEDICFAMSCNGSNFGSHDVELAVLNEIFGQSYELPSFDSVELTSEELDQYLGTYVTDDLPMDMIISKDGKTLMLEVPGQKPGPLEAKGDHKFVVMQYGVKMEFVPAEKKLLFEQQGYKFELVLQDTSPSAEQEVVSVVSQNEDLNKYVGTYTSDSLPIDLTIKTEDNKLVGQGEGQPSFALTDEGNHVFSNKEIGLIIQFIPEESKMVFEQGGAEFAMSMVD